MPRRYRSAYEQGINEKTTKWGSFIVPKEKKQIQGCLREKQIVMPRQKFNAVGMF